MTDFIIWAVPIWVIGSFLAAWMIGYGLNLRLREMDD